jgi:hypothetical protein
LPASVGMDNDSKPACEESPRVSSVGLFDCEIVWKISPENT